MINWYKNNWENTCGFVITVKNGSLFESEKQIGFTHFAEHLFFSGTDKLSREELRNKHFKIFNNLEAITNRDCVRVIGFFDLSDFIEALDILKQMIFEWKCLEKNFEDEKQQILDEIKDYNKSYKLKIIKEGLKFIPVDKRLIMGKFDDINKFVFEDLKEIKKYWQKLLKNSDLEVTFFTKNLTPKNLFEAEKVFNLNKKNYSKIIEKKCNKLEIIDFGRIENDRCLGWWMKNEKRSLNLELLDRIFYWRWYHGKEYEFDHYFLRVENFSAFYVFNISGLKDKKLAQNFLNTEISREEFEFAQNMLLKYFDQCLDMVNMRESFLTMDNFKFFDYVELDKKELSSAIKYLKNLKFENFSQFLATLPLKI